MKKTTFRSSFRVMNIIALDHLLATYKHHPPRDLWEIVLFSISHKLFSATFGSILYFHGSHYHLSLFTDFLQGSESPVISAIPISGWFGAATTSQCFDAQKCFEVKFYLLRILTTFAIFKKWDKTISEVLTKAGDTFVNWAVILAWFQVHGRLTEKILHHKIDCVTES